MNKARIAGVFYLLVFATGGLSLVVRGRAGSAAGLIAGLFYVAVTLLLIGYLIYKSTFLPRILGVLMTFGGLGWLTFLSPPLAHYLSPYNFAPGILGEGALTVWLLVFGVDVPKWEFMKTAEARTHA